jgi:hypothetical protein
VNVCKNKNYSPAFANSSFCTIKPTTTSQITTKKAENKKSHQAPFLINQTFCMDVDADDDEYISAQDDHKGPSQPNQLTSLQEASLQKTSKTPTDSKDILSSASSSQNHSQQAGVLEIENSQDAILDSEDKSFELTLIKTAQIAESAW